jgi:hypothetical protein
VFGNAVGVHPTKDRGEGAATHASHSVKRVGEINSSGDVALPAISPNNGPVDAAFLIESPMSQNIRSDGEPERDIEEMTWNLIR